MRRLVEIVSTLCLLALGLVGFGIFMSIGMTPSGPNFSEAVTEFWPVGASFLLTVIALVLKRTRPALAAMSVAGAAGLLIWIFQMMRS